MEETMFIDPQRCIGCRSCVAACRECATHKGYPMIFVDYIDRAETTATMPTVCMHCNEPTCASVCPVGALVKSEEGPVTYDASKCMGCRYCVQACPYGCRYIDPRKHVVDKCDLCYHRITKGLTTACAEACPTGARQLVDLKDPKDPVHAFLRTRSIQVLKPQMATHAKVFYAGLDGSVR